MDTEGGIVFLRMENLPAVPGHGGRYPTDVDVNLNATNPYTSPNAQPLGSDPAWQHDTASFGRSFAAFVIGLASLFPLVAFVTSCNFIYGQGWPTSAFRGTLHIILLSLFVLAFVSLAIVSVATYRRQRRRIVLGVFGTLVAIAVYIVIAIVIVAEGFFR